MSSDELKELKGKFRNDRRSKSFYDNHSDFVVNDTRLFRDAVWQGYTDACRTFTGISKEKKTSKDGMPFVKLAETIESYFIDPNGEFKHSRWCNDFMKNIGEEYGYTVRFGQAQKVVNMAFKYLYCCNGTKDYNKKFQECHMPFDQYTLLWLFKVKDVFYQEWSWFDEPNYNDAQNMVKEELGKNILENELKIWDEYKGKVRILKP